MADDNSLGHLPVPQTIAPVLPEIFEAEVEAARAYAAASRAASTRRAYSSDWAIFTAWCGARNIEPRPARPEAVALFLGAEAAAGVKPATIGRRLAAIGYMHRAVGFDAPQACVGGQAIRDVLAGIRRTHGARKTGKNAADADILRDMLHGIEGDSPRSVRDRALLAIGMAGAFRRSELVALHLADVEDVPKGLRITIGRSKTDQDGAGQQIAIPEGSRIRPKALLLDWIALAGFGEGPVFRKLTPQGRITAKPMSDKGVAIVVKARALAAGLDPATMAGHSLRAGFVTEAARRGANIFKMRDQSRHRSLDVLSGYVRNEELFDDHAGERFL